MRVQVEPIDQNQNQRLHLHLLYSLSFSARTTVDFFIDMYVIITPIEHYWTFHERENRLLVKRKQTHHRLQAYSFSKPKRDQARNGVSKEK